MKDSEWREGDLVGPHGFLIAASLVVPILGVGPWQHSSKDAHSLNPPESWWWIGLRANSYLYVKCSQAQGLSSLLEVTDP